MSLNDLSATPLQDAVDVNNLPEQRGDFAPPPQPGDFLFELSPLTLDNFDKVDGKEYGERVKVHFDETAPLVIRQSLGGEYDGTPFQTTITNIPMKRGKKDDTNAPIASDWDYLNVALKEAARPKSNLDYANKLMQKAGTRAQFLGRLEWSWRCNPNKNIYMVNEQGQNQEMDQLGCGTKTYQKDVAKVDGKFPERITCQCGASVRAFANIRTFKPAN